MSLVADDRAARLRTSKGAVFWVAAERAALANAAYPDAPFEPPLPVGGDAPDEEEAVAALVRGRAECSGPFTVGEMAGWLSLRESAVDIALARLEGEGMLLRGRFTPGRTVEEMCDRRILARIHRATIARLRREIEPVPVALFLRFLFRWQHVDPKARLQGDGGLLEVIDQLQGYETAAGAWEEELLPARLARYDPLMLDRLCFGG